MRACTPTRVFAQSLYLLNTSPLPLRAATDGVAVEGGLGVYALSLTCCSLAPFAYVQRRHLPCRVRPFLMVAAGVCLADAGLLCVCSFHFACCFSLPSQRRSSFGCAISSLCFVLLSTPLLTWSCVPTLALPMLRPLVFAGQPTIGG